MTPEEREESLIRLILGESVVKKLSQPVVIPAQRWRREPRRRFLLRLGDRLFRDPRCG